MTHLPEDDYAYNYVYFQYSTRKPEPGHNGVLCQRMLFQIATRVSLLSVPISIHRFFGNWQQVGVSCILRKHCDMLEDFSTPACHVRSSMIFNDNSAALYMQEGVNVQVYSYDIML